ncbi:Mannan endo-1,6-alpha-mannosidase [Scedosporium apiospermum]|uniref:Mannan endo-1,6-alpha-mannosidase n=1 Tax=Pseudallescheria apiosperma TaxID=563466 RepID=A0A084FUL9_PSEDA|nr:Mannan endo-1,6-alpha-mannosidase [Scedosporium apiospermum]KEZ38781.1 Mannan endo-1,6-alpha-mannosidase [Scedosporium apiospermum]
MTVTSTARRSAALLLALGSMANAQSVFKLDTDDEIRASARTLAYDTMLYYHGNETGQTPGILPGPPPGGDYYWWEGGALWGTMLDYWHYTGDSSYNSVISQALLFQVGEGVDYQPRNHTASLGNDDQGFWGMSAMLAAELNFPNPPSDQPQWLALAQAVWNTQAAPDRHDETCGGGMRWQIPLSNNGYNYKNTIANGCFFNLGARLARYTGNSTYMKYAEETWDWLVNIGYIADNWDIYDGAHVESNCTDINKAQFSYNAAVLLQGMAYLYDFTDGSQRAMWKTRIDGLLARTLEVFFPDNIAYEVSCEPGLTCTTDMYSFKGYVHRWLTNLVQLVPDTADKIKPVLKTSAQAAVNQCVGGDSQRACGFSWKSGKFDGKMGAGQQMNVLAAVSTLLVDSAKGPLTASSGGTSKGDVNAGSNSPYQREHAPITTGDRAGAGILTVIVLAAATGTFGWMSWER